MTLSPRQARKRRERNKALFVLAICVAFFGVVAYLWFIDPPTPLDEVTLCPTEKSGIPIASRRIVIVDATDSFNPVQRTWIERKLRYLQESTPTHGNLMVFAVRAGDTVARPLINKCNPGDGEALNRWTSNPDMWRRRWEEGFQQPVQALLDSLVTVPVSPSSPIMETIQAASLSVPLQEQELGVPRELHIFSDLLQHSDAHTHYGTAPPSYDAFANSDEALRIQPDLSGYLIWAYYVRRDGSIPRTVQGRAHIRFWELFFADRNGSLEEVIRVDG